jgi:hypothetical protein
MYREELLFVSKSLYSLIADVHLEPAYLRQGLHACPTVIRQITCYLNAR